MEVQRDAVWAAVEKQYLPTVPVPVHIMESFAMQQPKFCEPDRDLLKLLIRRGCTGNIGEPITVEKMDRCSCVGVGKDPGQIFVP